MQTLTPAVAGFVRGLGVTVFLSVLEYVGTHIGLSGLVSGTVATLIATLALAVEHQITAQTVVPQATVVPSNV
jgi:hypothetical protein